MVGFVANSLSLGLAVGATVLASRRLGAGEKDAAARAEGAALLAAIALSIAVVVRVGLAAALVPALGYPGILAVQALSPVLPCAVGAAYLRRYARRVRSETGIGAKAAL